MSTVFSHNPLNHPLRPVYRLTAAVTGAYLLVFGAVAFSKTGDRPAFTQDHTASVLGLHANRGFAEISIVAGIVVLLATLIGHNVDHWVDLLGGLGFMLAGGAMMALMRTDANVLGFTMATCIVSFVVGLLLFAAGMYIGVGTAEASRHRELERHGGHIPASYAPIAWRAITPAVPAEPQAATAQ